MNSFRPGLWWSSFLQLLSTFFSSLQSRWKTHYGCLGLELRYISFCTKLTNLSLRGCPIASLPDYRRIVLARLPPGSILDDDTEVNKSIIDEDAIFTTDDAILLKELVAEGLLDQDELLENEPVTRPFTAMGIRPKTTQFTPFQRPSSAFKRSPSGNGWPQTVVHSTKI